MLIWVKLRGDAGGVERQVAAAFRGVALLGRAVAALRYTRGMEALVQPPWSQEARAPRGWEARLDLAFRRDGERTLLAGRHYHGPLRVQKELHPEGAGICQAILVHPPGGIVGGDRLTIDVDVGERAHAQLTTPGATKWYRSAGSDALLHTRLAVGGEGVLEWLPQDMLVYNGARAVMDTQIELAAGARFIGWDVVGLGRVASGERYDAGRIRLRLDLFRDGALVWSERAVLEGGSRALHCGAILAGAPVFGTMIVAGVTVDDALLAAVRAVVCSDGEAALTRLPDVLVARYRGGSAIGARMHFASLWRLLRPSLAGRAAVTPRIWST